MENVAEGKTVDLLKIDCEGGEWEILGCPSLLRRTRFLRLEYHLGDGHTLTDLEALLGAGGHRIRRLERRTAANSGLLASDRQDEPGGKLRGESAGGGPPKHG